MNLLRFKIDEEAELSLEIQRNAGYPAVVTFYEELFTEIYDEQCTNQNSSDTIQSYIWTLRDVFLEAKAEMQDDESSDQQTLEWVQEFESFSNQIEALQLDETTAVAFLLMAGYNAELVVYGSGEWK